MGREVQFAPLPNWRRGRRGQSRIGQPGKKNVMGFALRPRREKAGERSLRGPRPRANLYAVGSSIHTQRANKNRGQPHQKENSKKGKTNGKRGGKYSDATGIWGVGADTFLHGQGAAKHKNRASRRVLPKKKRRRYNLCPRRPDGKCSRRPRRLETKGPPDGKPVHRKKRKIQRLRVRSKGAELKRRGTETPTEVRKDPKKVCRRGSIQKKNRGAGHVFGELKKR